MRFSDSDSDGNFSSRRRFSSGGHLHQQQAAGTLAINKPPNLGEAWFILESPRGAIQWETPALIMPLSVSDAESILNSPRCATEGFLKGAESDGDVHRVTVQGSAPRRHRKPACNDGKWEKSEKKDQKRKYSMILVVVNLAYMLTRTRLSIWASTALALFECKGVRCAI